MKQKSRSTLLSYLIVKMKIGSRHLFWSAGIDFFSFFSFFFCLMVIILSVIPETHALCLALWFLIKWLWKMTVITLISV